MKTVLIHVYRPEFFEIYMPSKSTSPLLASSKPAIITQCCCFAAAARPQQCQKLIMMNVQIDALQNLLVIKILRQIFKLNNFSMVLSLANLGFKTYSPVLMQNPVPNSCTFITLNEGGLKPISPSPRILCSSDNVLYLPSDRKSAPFFSIYCAFP